MEQQIQFRVGHAWLYFGSLQHQSVRHTRSTIWRFVYLLIYYPNYYTAIAFYRGITLLYTIIGVIIGAMRVHCKWLHMRTYKIVHLYTALTLTVLRLCIRYIKISYGIIWIVSLAVVIYVIFRDQNSMH